jgi:hypothetical protein
VVVLDGCSRLWAWNGLPVNEYISMYSRTNRYYNERGSRTNYIRSSKPQCTLSDNVDVQLRSVCMCLIKILNFGSVMKGTTHNNNGVIQCSLLNLTKSFFRGR